MGTGSVEGLFLKWFGRLPTVPVPFFGPLLASTVKKGDRHLAADVFFKSGLLWARSQSPFFTPVFSLRNKVGKCGKEDSNLHGK